MVKFFVGKRVVQNKENYGIFTNLVSFLTETNKIEGDQKTGLSLTEVVRNDIMTFEEILL